MGIVTRMCEDTTARKTVWRGSSVAVPCGSQPNCDAGPRVHSPSGVEPARSPDVQLPIFEHRFAAVCDCDRHALPALPGASLRRCSRPPR